MQLQAKIGIAITTYETDENDPKAILTHIFWGDTLDTAIGYAKSHLITDYSFVA
jgi:hypothetical protein